MKKKLSYLILVVTALSYASFANSAVNLGDSGVSLKGALEIDLFGRTSNKTIQKATATTPKAGFEYFIETDITLNIDGKHDSKFGNVVWRLAQKVATDYRYDVPGQREAWAGLEGKFGTLKVGNQFSNMYLVMDGPGAGGHGMGNLFSDYGAHEVQYTRSIMYATPVFEGAQLIFQTDIGGVGEIQSGKNAGDTVRSYAFEALLNYDRELTSSQRLTFNLGFYQGKNNGTLNTAADAFNGARTAQASMVSTTENTANVVLATFVYKIADISLNVAYKHNTWKGDIYYDKKSFLNTDDKTLANNQILGKIGYDLKFANINLGYQFVTKDVGAKEGIVNIIETKGHIQSIHLQYNHYISEAGANGGVAFVQIRHAMYKDKGTVAYAVDGKLSEEKNVTRFLVGIWYPF